MMIPGVYGAYQFKGNAIFKSSIWYTYLHLYAEIVLLHGECTYNFMLLLYIYLHVFPSILLCCSTVLPECNNSAFSTTSSSYHIILHRILSTDVIFYFSLYVCIVVVFIYFQTPRHQKSWLLNSIMNCCPAWDFLKTARMQFRQRLKELWNEFLTTKKKV